MQLLEGEAAVMVETLVAAAVALVGAVTRGASASNLVAMDNRAA